MQTPFQNQAAHHIKDEDPVQKAVNSGMGFIVGDILAQRLTGEAFDAVRSLELGLYGTLLGMLSFPICVSCSCSCPLCIVHFWSKSISVLTVRFAFFGFTSAANLSC